MRNVFKVSFLVVALNAAFSANAAGTAIPALPPALPLPPGVEAMLPIPASTQAVSLPRATPEIKNAATTVSASSTPATKSGVKGSATRQASASSEFQTLVQDSLGHALPVFGADIFASANESLTGVVPAAADYVVGPGDEINIKGWGSVDIDYRATVAADGNLYLPKVGTIFVAGTRFSDLQASIATSVRKMYRNFELNVSLGQMRAVEVMVVGQAGAPGTYQLSPYATVLTALSAAGGPTAKGSMRTVMVKRGGRTVATLDLYDVVLMGDRSKDVRLQPGDVVVVPAAGPQVALDGAVTAPAIYEIRKGESLRDLVQFAGGFSVSAKTDTLRIERVSGKNFNREVTEFKSPDHLEKFALADGDIVRVPRIVQEYSNAVTLRGAVAEPARMPLTEGMHVSDVLTSRDMLIEPGYWRNHNRSMSEKVDNEARLAGGLKRSFEEINWDYAVIERLNRKTLETQLVPFNLGKALEKDPSNDLALQAGDTITVFSKQDVRVPVGKQTRFVRIEGEVLSPGVYLATPDDTLQTMVQKAGGFTPQAYPYGASLYRDSVRKDQQRRMTETVAKLEQALEREARQRITDAMTADEVLSGKTDLDSQKQAVAKLREVKASGRIVLELKPSSKAVSDIPAISLEDGDQLTIPAMPSTVSVVGSVYNENSFIYRKDKSVDTYLAQAGGPLTPSASNLVYLAKADGSVTQASSSDKLNPGDTVVVVEEVGRKSLTRSVREWAQVFYQFGLGAAAVKVLK